MTEQVTPDWVMHQLGISGRNTGLRSCRPSDYNFIESILSDLRSESEQSRQHHLVLGKTGFGKTTLLRHVAHAAQQDQEVARKYIALSFSEEYSNINCIEDLWQSCLNVLPYSLSESVNTNSINTDEYQTIKAAKRDPNTVLDFLIDCLKSDNQRLLLFLDDLHLLLQRFKQELLTFLNITCSEANILVVATCLPTAGLTEHNDAISKNRFKLYNLRGFSESEGHSTMKQFAEINHAYHMSSFLTLWRPRKKRLHALTDGNPRMIGVIYNLIAIGIDGNIRDELEKTLDCMTNWYQSRLESLSPNNRKVLDLIALNWTPMSEKQVASELNLPRDTVSKELAALNHLLVKDKLHSKQRDHRTFYMRERLFNIWYLMRVDPIMSRKFTWLVRFLKLVFSPKELRLRARLHLATPPGDLRDAENCLILAQAVDILALRNALEYQVLQTSIINDLSPAQFLNLYSISAFPDRMHSKLQYIRKLRAIRLNVTQGLARTSIQLESFCDCLLGSPCLSIEEKQIIGDKAQEFSKSKWKMLEYFLLDEAKIWRQILKSHSGALYQAIRSGEMTSLSDTLGVASAAEHWQDPVLTAISWDAWLGIAQSLSKREVKRVEKIFRQAIVAEPNLAILQINLGKLLELHLMRLDEAEQAYRKAIEIDAKLALPWNRLADILKVSTKCFAEIENTYHCAIKAEPADPTAYNNLAWFLYLQQGKCKEAVKFAQKAVNLDPNNVCHTHTLATLLVATGKWATALPFVRRFIEDANRQNYPNIDANGVMLFKEIIRNGRVYDGFALINEIARESAYWRVMQQALEAILSDNSEHIDKIVSDDKNPAQSILRRLIVDDQASIEPVNNDVKISCK